MAFSYSFPSTMATTTLANGLKLTWLPDHEQPVLVAALQFAVGKVCNDPGREGAVELLSSLWQKGPRSLSSDEFAEKMENGGAVLFGDLGDEHLTIGIKMLASQADELFPLFWEMVVDPALDEKEFRRLQKEMLTALQTDYADPMTLAAKHFQAEVCGKDHPSGRTHSQRSVKALSTAIVRDLYTRFIAPRDAVMIVAGDFDREAMASRYESLFSSWSKTATDELRRGAPLQALPRTVIRCIDKPDLSQTTIALGHPTVGELHEAKNSLMLGNYILGGGNFSSRLMARIRSRTGNTYGISSQVMCDAVYGIFMVTTTTRNEHLKEVVEGILAEYAELMAKGVTEEELQKAKQFALGNLAFELEGVGNVVEKLLWLRLYGRENSYLENYPRMIESIDAAAVNTALAAQLNSPHFAISAVGRGEVVRPIMAQFGEVRPYDYRAEP